MTDKEMIKRHWTAMKALFGKKYFVTIYIYIGMTLLFPIAGCVMMTVLSVKENADMFFVTCCLPLLTGLYNVTCMSFAMSIFPADFTAANAKAAKTAEMMRKAYNGSSSTSDICACFPINRTVLVKGLCGIIAPMIAVTCLNTLYLSVLSFISESNSVKIYSLIIVTSIMISTIYGEELIMHRNNTLSTILSALYCLVIIACSVLLIGSLIMDEDLAGKLVFLKYAAGFPLIILSVIFTVSQIYLLKTKLPKDAEGTARNGERAEVLG